MESWDLYRTFLEIHRGGSLKMAATSLGVNQTTVGRNLNTLERQIGNRLFERRSDGFVLTASGHRILKTIETIDETMLGVNRLLAGKDERPEGVVKIAMPGALANHWLIPRLQPLLSKFPKLELQFLTGPELVNLARRDADIALRLVKPTQRGIVTRRLGTISLGLFIHQDLIKKEGAPKNEEDLGRYPFVGLFPEATSDSEMALFLSIEGCVRVGFRSSAWSSTFSAVSGGLGVGFLPSFMVRDGGPLRQVLKDRSASMPLWLAFHPDLKNSARVRAVLDFITNAIQSDF